MKSDYLIIGGGIAGLSAANRLAESGVSVILLEGGTYPTHKVCGEFLSPEAFPILDKWGITPGATIKRCEVITSSGKINLPFPDNAGSLSRYQLDYALANRAKQLGAIIIESSQVQHLEMPSKLNDSFIAHLNSEKRFEAPTIMVSTGKFFNSTITSKKFPYIGVKAHFSNLQEINHLIMYLMPEAYFGMAPIEDGKINVAGIIRFNPEKYSDPLTAFSNLLHSKFAEPMMKKLKNEKCLFDKWLITPVPEFGVRRTISYPRLFSLGDAAGTIPPASGNGLAMGLTSGIMAAEMALNSESECYANSWQKEYYWRIQRGKLLHKSFLSPQFSKTIPWIAKSLPWLPKQIFNWTRGKR